MEVYNDKDLIAFNENVQDILEKVELVNIENTEPLKPERDRAMSIINKFIKENNRKIYGGYALNLLLKDKNPADAIYDDVKFADIDFYSPEPIQDLIKIANLLHDAGFKEAYGKEAQHKETYSVFANSFLYCDITYVPKNIYNRMPFVELEGFKVIHPHFMMIDFFRMFTDPLVSYWRLEKTMPRFYKLQKYYPLLKIKNNIDMKPVSQKLYDNILNIIKNREDLIVIGGFAYNQFLKKSGNENIKPLNNPPFELILVDYETQGEHIKNQLKKIDQNLRFVEHYPYFQFTPHSCNVYDGQNNLVLRMQGTHKKCYPYSKVNLNKDDYMIIGSFDLTLLYCMIYGIIHRTHKENKEMNNYQRMISDLIDMRNSFFNKHSNKTLISETIFKSFQVDCIGTSVHPKIEYFDMIKERKKKKQGPYIFKYEPFVSRKEPESNYMFNNSSGNPINNTKNLKLTKPIDQSNL